MDYEKKYKEALERARALRNEAIEKEYVVDYIKDYETIFPELRGSEDERVRKEIVSIVKAYRDNCIDEGTHRFDDCLSWLEKQKEQKPVNEEAEKEKTDYVSGQFLYCRGSFNEFKEGESYWLEYVGDDTYVGRSDNVLNQKFHITPRQLYTWLIPQHDCGEQKPAEWSEEDKKMMECCLVAINHYEKTCNIGDHLPTKFNIGGYLASVDKVKSWLKSLRSQPIQLKEAYKDGFQTARQAMPLAFMSYLDENRPDGKMGLSNGECEDIDEAFKKGDWAKIMRYYEKYRPSWRPSEEQMKALDKAIPVCMGVAGCKEVAPLESLYNDLKKLI